MVDSSEQSSGFWTLTRPSKLSKRRNSDLHELHHKVFNISVVGLSGVEKDKGPLGIGKSCLCNRFVRSAADDYQTDHISVLSQTDFNGRVVNNDHWLFWGSVIKSCDGYDLAFNIIEQTEFVDDACFQPFKSGKTESYVKRCANTKLVSAEKLMYICKNQLGIEREYEQRYLPDGKFNVDGFLCLFDVSEVQGRNVDKQIEITNLIMLNLIKTRKPIVFVTTKNDEANELLVAEAERIVNQREYRGIVPIVETSAQKNINVHMAFLVCAQLIDKTRAKLRVPPYYEAHKNHLDLLNAASDAYLGLIRSTVIDHRSSWQQVCIKLAHNPEFLQYTYLHGLDKAMLVFKNHLKQLRDECIHQKVQNYLKVFPDLLNELIPQTSSNMTSETEHSLQMWDLFKDKLRSHSLFNKYFLHIPSGVPWYETDLLQSNDNRIPFDWLDSEEACAVFKQRTITCEAEKKRQNAKEMFAQMLSNINIPVGEPFIELKHMFKGNQSLALLNDKEMFEIYVKYQNNLLQQARADFQELLLENAEHLHHLTSSNKVIRQEDIKTINAILQHDERYQALDKFDQDRTLMMIRHLSFLHSQITEQCPSYPKCVEPEVERLLITKAKTLVSRHCESSLDNSKSYAPHTQKTCDLVIFGPRRPSQQLILALNVLNLRAPKESQYQITFTVFDNADEVDNQIQRFRQSNTKQKGCFGIFTNQRSLEHVSYTLERFLIFNSQAQNDRDQSFGGNPPVVMLYAADITLDERTMLALENEGQQMADRFKCPFMNVTAIDQYRQHQQNNILTNEQDTASQVMSECASLDYACVDAAFNVLKEAVSRRVCFMELYNNQDLIPRQAFNPDAKILMCLLCGEPFSNELLMWKMFLDYEDCYVTSSKSICLKTRLDDGQEKFIEVTITSYTHGAFNYREDLLHGFILVCSIQRRASLSILNAFSFNIPCTPVLVMAVNGDSIIATDRINVRLDEGKSDSLIKEAQITAERLNGHFQLIDIRDNEIEKSYNITNIKSFLQDIIQRKPAIEKAYDLGDNEVTPMPTSSACINNGSSCEIKPIFTSKGTADKMLTRNYKSPYQPLTTKTAKEGEMSDITRGILDRNLSDDSEVSSTNSNSAPPKPIRFTKSEKEDTETLTAFIEPYAKRPLPPIPPAPDHYEPEAEDRVQFSAPCSATITPPSSSGNKKLHHKFIDVSSTQTSRQMQVSEDTNDSCSDEDTEDSADNRQDKPKPGKLDLRQFDNITNAIGKLNVQPLPIKASPNDANFTQSIHSKVFANQVFQENPAQESGSFFKNQPRKAKTKTKETIQKEEEDFSGSNDELASFHKTRVRHEKKSDALREKQDLDKLIEKESRVGVSSNEENTISMRKLGLLDRVAFDNQAAKISGSVKDKSSRFNFKNDATTFVETTTASGPTTTKLTKTPTSSFLNQALPPAQDLPESTPSESSRVDLSIDPLPRPAPRTAQQIATSHQSSSTSSTTVPPAQTYSTSTSATTSVVSTVGANKRINNPRQNHGRAVAPPQLPGSAICRLNSNLGEFSSTLASEQPSNETVTQLANEEVNIDFDQSPIAQRLLNHSKDYKVSEFNSPYESENEQTQSTNRVRSQKMQRGQSLASENSSPAGSLFINSSIDSSELINSRGAAIRQLNEILANKQPPGRLGGPKSITSRSSSLDQNQSQQQSSSQSGKKSVESKKDKKKIRDDEKLEKRRLKEEERQKRQEKKSAAKKSKSSSSEPSGCVGDDGIPFFIKRCIEFIEHEGLDAEGIYRVPGNRAHVDAFILKFKENPEMSIVESDIPVNAVATALKDFLSKKWGPIIPLALMNELTELSSILEKEKRVQAVRQLIKKLPPANYKLLKYVFSHFVKISLNHSLNSMDSKNLAICWWPTLLPLHFSDMVMFEQMRPHLEESIQTMIDQYEFIFDDEEPRSLPC